MSCAAVSILMSHMNGEKELNEFSNIELGLLPLDYLIKYASPFELLLIFGKLPTIYQANFELRISLPCFFHYNRPESRTHFDGPPTSQRNCRICNKSEFV